MHKHVSYNSVDEYKVRKLYIPEIITLLSEFGRLYSNSLNQSPAWKVIIVYCVLG